jgi:hypothetical protein
MLIECTRALNERTGRLIQCTRMTSGGCDYSRPASGDWRLGTGDWPLNRERRQDGCSHRRKNSVAAGCTGALLARPRALAKRMTTLAVARGRWRGIPVALNLHLGRGAAAGDRRRVGCKRCSTARECRRLGCEH